jgi:GNAT superfamily N-acetyltransferase
MLIRALDNSDIAPAARLLRELAREFIVHESPPEAAATFLRENDEDGIRAYLAKGYVYHVADTGAGLAGFIAVRDASHLFHLFVARDWQGQGVAHRLWEVARTAALASGNPGVFTVNSSKVARPVYESFGFVATAPLQCKNGIYFHPMQLTLGTGTVNAPLQADATTSC